MAHKVKPAGVFYQELRKLIHNLPEHGVINANISITNDKVEVVLVMEAMDEEGTPIVVDGKIVKETKCYSLIEVD